MVKYMIYLALALLICWSFWSVGRAIVRQLRGGCGRDSHCAACGGCSNRGSAHKTRSHTCRH
ncbi:hypothetical protein D1159_12190 [Pseudoflavonifractor sp. 524-17]|uniref:hypothetical protein n=1 Tax=Pseudoflavonifractor sp. 524-17 TaxID=2304577 RepID=UPI00137AA0B8|nr:hypothetical protein [Pseudoflavonifractor sp. 524-17]NCE65318.1 hypothetical protein [Pseudoflavonifractor sp. 524-17]